MIRVWIPLTSLYHFYLEHATRKHQRAVDVLGDLFKEHQRV